MLYALWLSCALLGVDCQRKVEFSVRLTRDFTGKEPQETLVKTNPLSLTSPLFRVPWEFCLLPVVNCQVPLWAWRWVSKIVTVALPGRSSMEQVSVGRGHRE